ncbi:MAG: outer membrane beta-barrel protein [Rhodospirillales bacterium]|nr:outer membrane beta-barrel protein [Rhodospirillales bacterium]
MAEPDLALTHERLLRPARLMALHVEVAGADDTNPATPKQLEDAGTNMVPAEELKKVEPVMQPRVNKVPEEKEPQVIMPAKAEPPEKQPMATEMPLVESKPETPAQMENTLAGPYLRLDAGYAFNRDSDGTQTAGDFTSESIGGTAVWGGGIGYRFNENLRSDVTFSYRPDADVSATTAAGNTASTEVSALSVMLNAYWDVITVDKVTPYLGAGIGMAHLSTSDQATSGGIGTETGATANNFAWSLTAGAAYAVLDNTSLDMNYRFINLGDFGQQGSTSYDALMAHEVRAGLRVIF